MRPDIFAPGVHGHGIDLSTATGSSADTLRSFVAGVAPRLGPGEIVVAWSGARAPVGAAFLGGVSARKMYTHFLVVTTSRLLVFTLTPKAWKSGLAALPQIVYGAPRHAVFAGPYGQGLSTDQLRLYFPEGRVRFEVTRAGRLQLSQVAAMLPRWSGR